MKKVIVAIILAFVLGNYAIVFSHPMEETAGYTMPEGAGTNGEKTIPSHETDDFCIGPVVLSEKMFYMITIAMGCVLMGWLVTFWIMYAEAHMEVVRMLTIVLVVFAVTVLGLLHVLEGNTISALFGAIVGHVLGSAQKSGTAGSPANPGRKHE